jgi:outer membrane lipoprotein carrier protein
VRWVRLVPKAPGDQYAAIEMGLNDTMLSMMRLTDNLGQVMELSFSAVERNPAVDPASFRFEIPAGVDVVTGVTTD